MSQTPIELNLPATESATEKAAEKNSVDYMEIVRHPAFLYGVLVFVALGLCFMPMFRLLPKIWLGEDGYYSHGFLVPFISGYIIYRWWPRLKTIPVKPGWIAALGFIPLIYVMRIGYLGGWWSVMSACLIGCLLFGTWFVAGWKWMLALFAPIVYLLFALPVMGSVIEVYTNPLQIHSTTIAFQLLKAFGFQPFQPDTTTIYLNQFVLDVGVPCSGLKMVVAVGAFMVFFMLIGGLKWWGNLGMLVLWLPLCLFVNGLRIALIGVVGDIYGSAAGHQFHDYSGFIMLILCFFIFFKAAKVLGWKD